MTLHDVIPQLSTMGRKGKELTPDKKNAVLELFLKGLKPSEVCRLLEIPYSTVFNILKKFKTSGTLENKPRSGRPKIVTDRAYRQLERLVKTNRRSTLGDITSRFNQGRQKKVSRRTVQHHLKKHGYSRRVCRKKMVIKVENRKKRLAWCLQKRKWSVEEQWKKVIFSDESQVVMGNDGRVYVWRKRGEGHRPDLLPTQSKRKFSVMIWGCVCWHGVGTLTRVIGNINSEKYINILEDNIWPVIARHFPDNGYLFQDDNAPVHRSRVTQEYMARNQIKNMSWPAQSPDLNIIENVWLFIKRKLCDNQHMINSETELYNAIAQIWTAISPQYIQSLYNSIPRRLMNVIRLKGHLTKY